MIFVPLRGEGSCWNIAIRFGMEKLEWCGNLMVTQYKNVTDSKTDRHTGGQTPYNGTSHT